MLVTKLKKFSRQWYSKFTAYLLIIILAACFIFSGITMMDKVSDPSAFESKTYANSSAFAQELSRVTNNVIVMQYDYISEENIKNGGALNEESIYRNLYESNAYQRYRQNYYDNRNDVETYDNSYDNSAINEAAETQTEELSVSLAVMQEHPDWEMFDDGVFVRYLSDNPLAVDAMRKSMIDDQLRNYQRVQTFLNSIKGQFAFSAHRADTQQVLENEQADEIKKMPLYAEYNIVDEDMKLYQYGEEEYWRSMGYENFFYTPQYSYSYQIGPNDTLLVGVYPDYLSQREQEWQLDHKTATDCVIVMIVSFILSVALFIYLCVVTGRVPQQNGVQLNLLDRMFSEVHIVILIALNCVLIAMLDMMGSSVINLWPMILGTVCGILAIGIPILLSLVRSLKAHRLFRSFAIGRLCIRFHYCVRRMVRGIWEGGSLMARGIIIAVLVPIFCVPIVTIPFVIAALVYIIYRMVSRFQKVQEGVKAVRSGNLNYKIEVKGGDLGALAQDINTLSEGLETAISSEVKAERLKTELISNVSHDIKTPLTSIITYVDLLKTELGKEQPNESSLREYADIIERKTGRLRMLTNDLFEAAKATSGAMTVNLEQVDVQALVRQGLAEFDDKLQTASLDMRVKMPEKPVYISADGRLVWRIFENMLSNVVKYAFPGSRVYLDVTTGQGQMWMTMKNISAYELNVPAEELMERFKRGDESRSSEGSGLGLSIAISLAQLQHGVFNISVDGDLFKAMLAMPIYRTEDAPENIDVLKKN